METSASLVPLVLQAIAESAETVACVAPLVSWDLVGLSDSKDRRARKVKWESKVSPVSPAALALLARTVDLGRLVPLDLWDCVEEKESADHSGCEELPGRLVLLVPLGSVDRLDLKELRGNLVEWEPVETVESKVLKETPALLVLKEPLVLKASTERTERTDPTVPLGIVETTACKVCVA